MNDRAFCPSRSACDAPHGWDPYPNHVGLAYLPVAPQASHLGEAPSSSLHEPHQGRGSDVTPRP